MKGHHDFMFTLSTRHELIVFRYYPQQCTAQGGLQRHYHDREKLEKESPADRCRSRHARSDPCGISRTGQQDLPKYAATRLGDHMIAHHIMFERRWEVKGPSLDDPEMLAEEREFQLGNPHHEMLMKVFDLANIQYGRIDYAMHNGRMQVWEINTNPTLLYPRDHYTEDQMPAKLWFTEQLNNALIGIDDKSPSRPSWFARVFGG